MKSQSIVIVRTQQSINSNSSISELMEFTRTAFRRSDFEMVEKILADREKKKEKFEVDNCGLVREKLEMEEEIERLNMALKEKDETIDQMQSQITELSEELDKRVLCLEKDVALIKEQNKEADTEPSQAESKNQNPAENVSQFQHIINLDDDDDDVIMSDGDKKLDISTTMHKRKEFSQHDDDDHRDDVSMPAGEPVADMANAGPLICRHVSGQKLSLQPQWS